MEEVETIIKTEAGIRISVDQWNDGVWVILQARQSNMHFGLTRSEAEQVLRGLQTILAKGAV